MHCYGSESMYIKYDIAFPFKYYSMQGSSNNKDERFPTAAYWDVTTDQNQLTESSIYLYTGSETLNLSTKMIKMGQPQKAVALIKREIASIGRDNKNYKALLYNNLAMGYLVLNDIHAAKNNINQAGTLCPSDHKILKNARLVTTFFHTKFTIIKNNEK